MNAFRPRPHVLPVLLACLLPLAACSREPAPADPATAGKSDTLLGQAVRQGLEKARQELATKNIPIGGDAGKGINLGGRNRDAGDLPRAEISPQGDLLIDGKAVPVNEEQRRLLLVHRARIVAIAEAGIEVGAQGADLGAKAAVGALKSVLSGDSDAFEKQMEAEGRRIEAEALKICDRMPALLQSQQALAAVLPAFVPYATMDASDIEDCREDREAAEAAEAAAS
ncbi:hypothetical protein B1992_02965 [Pseudoxanthomonas broegbernensis]|uniref:DUF2884 family protein n=1 Tax=Pseudoxanthomonas broegbernensis TaxID=83619 RepID=A0A7V8K835_9GAMM|nr:YggN family protein [Pseudoxanthomonas broegbernensis]KAF1687634.1 hypothetical protein B1992_02965 [Pseudoxanthomonas broegbernensis]MBB6064659.1 hypothetical protein [Pseudoxanthomonas broegbernensis]